MTFPTESPIEAAKNAIAKHIETLPGWCSPDKGMRMAELAAGRVECVELGVFGGRSLMAVAMGLKASGGGRVHGIDPYTAEAALEGTNHQKNAEWWGSLNFGDIEACARSAIDQHALAAHAWLLKMKSREAAKLFRDRSVDFLHQDANHSEETSCEEVILWSPKMKSGGIWVFDDSNWPSTQKAQKILLALDYTMLEDHKSWRVYKAPDFATAESIVAPPEPTTPLGPTGPWQDEPKRGPTGPSATFPPIPDPPPTPVPQ